MLSRTAPHRIEQLLAVHARFVAMLPAIREAAIRNPAEVERLQAICRGEIDPAPEES